ncbi:beta-lactamase family protein [Kitasatospora sp. NBC_01287]|uniref:serine hydrolase domain-containing protein n=1 Tax=Kitasatospora sp. NBC_01287 TaxID=2903573 RepID=UPI002259AB59|nr:serine hydrolase domain-containing protein [Kitasatospora sp. NBC_01287]MCX4748115.1 beta-lactamase family protein [Kitasatospora sp. NBC_01287]
MPETASWPAAAGSQGLSTALPVLAGPPVPVVRSASAVRRSGSSRFGGPAGPSVRLAGARTPLGQELASADALRIERRLRPLFQGLPPQSGVAVAVVQGDQRTVACRGYTDPAALRPVRADTRFELGSVTKTFTTLLLAEMAARGEVRYDDPIDRYLPVGAVPGYPKERPITLLHLATHTSGLPRLPVGLLPSATPQWYTRPCATFGVAHVLHSLARTPVRGTPGTRVRYSSLGCGLLGMVLENAAGIRYEDLLASRVCGPLGLLDTSCGPGGEVGSGYRRGRRVPSFRMPALPGAAALRSSADDMLRYLQALVVEGAAENAESALRTALGEVRRPRVAWRLAGTRICLGWKQRPIGSIPDVLAPDGARAGLAAELLRGARADESPGRAARPALAARVPSALVDGAPWPPGQEPDVRRAATRAPAARDRGAWASARERLEQRAPEPVVPEPVVQELLFHEGGTRGFLAFAGFVPEAGTGLVALVSSPPANRRRFLHTAHETLRRLTEDQQGG